MLELLEEKTALYDHRGVVGHQNMRAENRGV